MEGRSERHAQRGRGSREEVEQLVRLVAKLRSGRSDRFTSFSQNSTKYRCFRRPTQIVRRRHRDGRCRQRRRPEAGSPKPRVSTREAALPLSSEIDERACLSGEHHRLGVRQIGPESSEGARVARAGATDWTTGSPASRSVPIVGWTAREVASVGVDNPHRVRPSVRGVFGELHLESVPAISLARSLQVNAVQAGNGATDLAPVEKDPNLDWFGGDGPSARPTPAPIRPGWRRRSLRDRR